MRRWHITASSVVLAGSFATAAALLSAGAPAPQPAIACDVQLNVIDPDPQGLNVRTAPSAESKVVAVLKPDAEWITVHVTAQHKGWMRIDRAVGIDDDAPNGERVVFSGDGWVSAKMLGISGLYVGGGATLYQRADRRAPVVFRLKTDDLVPSRVLGCQGTFIRVRYDRYTGWTDTWCNNERTTCS